MDNNGEDGGHGAIDIKVTDSILIKLNQCYARNGPVLANGVLPFKWKNTPEGLP